MCPGCMTAAALQELGPNPAAALLALFARSLARPGSAPPNTGAAAANVRTAASVSANANQGG
jgi:hypothetical protein